MRTVNFKDMCMISRELLLLCSKGKKFVPLYFDFYTDENDYLKCKPAEACKDDNLAIFLAPILAYECEWAWSANLRKIKHNYKLWNGTIDLEASNQLIEINILKALEQTLHVIKEESKANEY